MNVAGPVDQRRVRCDGKSVRETVLKIHVLESGELEGVGRGVNNGRFAGCQITFFKGHLQPCQRLAAMGAGDVAVAIGRELPVHDVLFGHLDKIDSGTARGLVIAVHQVDHPGHGNRVADHGGLGHAGFDGHGDELAFIGFGLAVVLEHGVGVHGLDADDLGQGINDTDLMKLEKSIHDGGDVARISDGHHHHLVGHGIVEILRDFIGVGLLSQDAPGVLRVEQGDLDVLGQGFDDFHAIVEHPGNLEDVRPAAERLGKLLGRHFLVGQQDSRLDMGLEIGRIEGRGGAGVPCGSADGEHLVDQSLPDEKIDVAQGTGHAPVLEGGAGVLAVILVEEADASLFLKDAVGFDHRRVAFSQVNH